MTDGHGRRLNYLRISVTDRCNLRCGYCMPEQGVQVLPHAEILTFDEIERVARVMAGLGVNRLRITGGEPLVRRGVVRLAGRLRAVAGIGFLGMTTNGVLLAENAAALCKAGVDGINLSLDTTDPQRYALLTRRDEWDRMWAGLQAALAQPFASVKLNCVLSPQSMAEDWLGVVGLAQTLPVDVRLIEWMPMDGSGRPAVGADEALAQIEARYGKAAPLPFEGQAGPARYYRLDGFRGKLGFIPAMSHSFCAGCNRLRLTATGDLKLCLFYDTGVALKPLLRGGADDETLRDAILAAVAGKPLRHGAAPQPSEREEDTRIRHAGGMYGIGG